MIKALCREYVKHFNLDILFAGVIMTTIRNHVLTLRVHATTCWIAVAGLWAVICIFLVPTYPHNTTMSVIGAVVFYFFAWLNLGGLHSPRRKAN